MGVGKHLMKLTTASKSYFGDARDYADISRANSMLSTPRQGGCVRRAVATLGRQHARQRGTADATNNALVFGTQLEKTRATRRVGFLPLFARVASRSEEFKTPPLPFPTLLVSPLLLLSLHPLPPPFGLSARSFGSRTI